MAQAKQPAFGLQGRLLDLSRRSHPTQSGGEGVQIMRRHAASPFRLSRQDGRAGWHPTRRCRDSESGRHRLSHRLRDHVIRLDLAGSTIVQHHVARRPQCPTLQALPASRMRPAHSPRSVT